MMENAFYFNLKALFVLRIFKFLSWRFGNKVKQGKVRLKFKIYDITTRLTNNCNTNIAQYLPKERQPDKEIWSVNRI